MELPRVIVFGPTGAVGSAAAITAARLGANVTLAMRDIGKPIPGLDKAQERQGKFQRLHADLTKPDTIHDAVQTSRAKHAFIYLQGTSDHMRATAEALKAAGIELVVFLSSFTVRGELAKVPPSDVISYIHAQVEVTLADVFPSSQVVAIRAGSFASNMRLFKGQLGRGDVKIFRPDAMVDLIVPEDIGAVAGTILAKGPQDAERAIYLYGPQIITQAESIRILARVLGRSVKIGTSDEEEALKFYVEEHEMPMPVAKALLHLQSRNLKGDNQVFGNPIEVEHLSNVQRYSGKKATTLEEWAEKHKPVFQLE